MIVCKLHGVCFDDECPDCSPARIAQLEREAAAWREVVEVVNKGMKYHATGCAVVMLVETYLRKESGNDKRTGK